MAKSTTTTKTDEAPKATEEKNTKKLIKKATEKGVHSLEEAIHLFEISDVKPLKVFKGAPVTALYCTQDGQFFYTKHAAAQHSVKNGFVNSDDNSKAAVFQVNIK